MAAFLELDPGQKRGVYAHLRESPIRLPLYSEVKPPKSKTETLRLEESPVFCQPLTLVFRRVRAKIR